MISGRTLRAEDLHYSYEGPVAALRGVSLSLPPALRLALIGQNGSGKTTLARLLAGVLRPWHGRVLLDDEDIRPLAPGRLARSVGIAFQNPDHQIFSPTVRQEISFGLRNLGCNDTEIEARTAEALERFELIEQAEDPPAALSFGLRRKVTVAALYAMRPPILILDEPTLGLEWGGSLHLMEAMLELNREGHTLLFISHDMRIVARYAQQCALLSAGQLLALRPTEEILYDTELLHTNRLAAPPIIQLCARLQERGIPLRALTTAAFLQQYRALQRDRSQ